MATQGVTAAIDGDDLMDMTGQQRIPANRDTVWRALNDVEVLKACIPGCQELTKTSDTEMTAMAVIRVGPVTAKFQGAVTLSDIDPPNGYRITGEGQGGVAGFAKGGANIRLEQEGDDTILHYDVSAQVGGKLSQLGGRLIDATAKQMSNLFFKRFAEEIQARYGNRAGATATPARAGASTAGAGASQASKSRSPDYPGFASNEKTSGFFHRVGVSGVILLIVAIAACWYLFGSTLPARPTGGINVSPDLVSGVILILVAAVGYLFGRQQSSFHLDRETIDRLAQAIAQQRN